MLCAWQRGMWAFLSESLPWDLKRKWKSWGRKSRAMCHSLNDNCFSDYYFFYYFIIIFFSNRLAFVSHSDVTKKAIFIDSAVKISFIWWEEEKIIRKTLVIGFTAGHGRPWCWVSAQNFPLRSELSKTKKPSRSSGCFQSIRLINP